VRRLSIRHVTRYSFHGTVRLDPHRLLIRPREGPELRIESSRLVTTPASTIRWFRDAYDNSVTIASFDTPTNQLEIVSEVVVQHYDEAPLDFLVADHAVYYPFSYESRNTAVLAPYLALQPGSDGAALRSWAASFWQPDMTIQTYTLLARICAGIRDTMKYQMREEPGVQTAAETLQRGVGSCRDFANLYMETVRALGLAARFVSGYLDAGLPDKPGATHAWAEVYIPGAGWKGFDPTLGNMVGADHIAVAVACVPDNVPPVSGAFFGPPGAELAVDVRVTTL